MVFAALPPSTVGSSIVRPVIVSFETQLERINSSIHRVDDWGELDNNIVAGKNKPAWDAALKAAGNAVASLRCGSNWRTLG
jgi:hypothetical protein